MLIDKMIIREVKMRKQNQSMACIDYKKVYMVSHSCIIDCFETVGINEKIQRLLAESMKSWQVELISAEENLGEANIRQGIVQDDSLSPLLFMCLLQLIKRCSTRYHFASNEQKVNHLLFFG